MSAWTTVVTAVGVAGTGATKVSTLTAGIGTAVRDSYAAKADDKIRAEGLRLIDTVLAEIAASNASLQTALGL